MSRRASLWGGGWGTFRRRAALTVWSCSLSRSVESASGSGDSMTQDVSYIWPAALWQVTLFAPEASGDSAGLTKRLSALAEEGYRKYLEEVLPKELEGDTEFRRAYEDSDASTRNNEAFVRYQKMGFSETSKVPLNEVNWIGDEATRLKNVNYVWKELYDSPDFKRLQKNIEGQCYKFLKHITSGRQERQRARMFVWAEVYRPGDFMHPHIHTGAAAAGVFSAGNSEGEGARQRFVLQDVRGNSAPFGHFHEVMPEEGEIIIHPAWMSNFFTPHPGNKTNVYFGFLMWPPGGAFDFDWEDDATGDYVFHKKTSVKKSAPNEKSQEDKHSEL
mmetsp:Transcript_1091/g.2645  ORF Transcript_1091/g.2645 Transcript_1091/m.2645 type:complete len:331 (+) Transcript_1091:154-1146(+)|eukprot:CAMPEP_0183436948 /NCGR_PEP_ID=MMETSP0370-20130417/70904_1 /TAXON_ID=268820 /ORGANISM="Peridinium aciculiferum, Strain PAER-2" /LENGTH=330 /DNA_ID=CAMNT_0025624571 /DNA_START=123 /DNA_END=1115 /DNA_ORIENTATION=-